MAEPDTTGGTQRRTTYREVFAQPLFRVLFYATAGAVAAHTLQIMALSVLVFRETNSPLLGAITFGIAFLPQLLGGTLLGSLTDRVSPRTLILVGYAVECASATCLALVGMPVGARLGLVAAVGLLMPLYLGASNRLLADIFAPSTGEQPPDPPNKDAYVLARSVFQLTASGAQLVGLAVGGVAVAAVGPRSALLVTAGLFVLAGVVIRTRLPREIVTGTADETADPRTVLRRSFAANRELVADPIVRRLLLVQWLPPACATGAESLLVPYGLSRGFAEGTPSLLLAAVPAGMLLGDFVVGRFLLPRTRERLSPWLIVLMGVPLIVFVVSPALVPAAALLVLAGSGFGYALGVQRVFLDAVPERLRGQAFTLRSAGLMTAQGLGPAVFGAVAQFSAVPTAIALAGGCAVCSAGLLNRGARAK